MDDTSRVVMITGAASGMGAASAREFAAAGDTVVIVDRNQEPAEEVAAEIGSFVSQGCCRQDTHHRQQSQAKSEAEGGTAGPPSVRLVGTRIFLHDIILRLIPISLRK